MNYPATSSEVSLEDEIYLIVASDGVLDPQCCNKRLHYLSCRKLVLCGIYIFTWIRRIWSHLFRRYACQNDITKAIHILNQFNSNIDDNQRRRYIGKAFDLNKIL